MNMEDRITALEDAAYDHGQRLEAIEKWMGSIDNSLKTLITIAKTLKWVGYVVIALWILAKTGDPAKLVSLFKGA